MKRSEKIILGLLCVALLVTWGFASLLLRYFRQPAGAAPAGWNVSASGHDAGGRPQLPATWTLTPPPPTAEKPSPVPSATLVPTPTETPTRLAVTRPTSVAEVSPTFVHPSSTLPIPTPVALLDIPDEATTILLLGSDQRPDWQDWHTDAVQFVVIYPEAPSVAILSIPRDLYVYIPGFWMSRINFADLYGVSYQYEGGAFGLLNQTLLYNLGISADYYVKVDFDGLISLVDALGGIDIAVHCQLEDYWPYPDENGEYPWKVLAPGIHHLDGETALWYARSRKTTSVFSRERRQQQVLVAMWRRGRELDLLSNAPALYEQSRHLFETDLDLGEILALAVTAAQLQTSQIRYYNIGPYDVTAYTTPYGGGVFLPRSERVIPIVESVLAPPAVNRAGQDPVAIEIWNGTPYADWDRLLADRLLRYNFAPLIAETDRHDYPATELVVFETSAKGSQVSDLQSLLGIRDGNVIYQPEQSPVVGLRLIVGQDYQTCW